MKKLFFILLSFTALQVTHAKKSDVRLVHPSCHLAVDTSYSNDGLNNLVTQAATKSLTKKGYKMTTVEEAQGSSTPTMVMMVDLTTTPTKSRGKCKAILSLRGTVEQEGTMLLANWVKKSGSLASVASKCIKGVIKAIKAYPKCSTVLDPDAQQDEPTPTPPSDDQGGDNQNDDGTNK